VLQWGGCGGRSTAPLHSRAVRGDELNGRSSTPTFGSTTKLQHIRYGRRDNHIINGLATGLRVFSSITGYTGCFCPPNLLGSST
jgi:hypothetical protein